MRSVSKRAGMNNISRRYSLKLLSQFLKYKETCAFALPYTILTMISIGERYVNEFAHISLLSKRSFPH